MDRAADYESVGRGFKSLWARHANLTREIMEEDIKFMRLALREAEKAAEEGEIPVGAVIVAEGKVIARGRNSRERWKDPTAHAEIIALKRAAKRLGRWRLKGTTVYVTVEPCPMCAGAMVLARIKRLVYSCVDSKGGACGSLYNIPQDNRLNHQVEVVGGVLEREGQTLLKGFFKELRGKKITNGGEMAESGLRRLTRNQVSLLGIGGSNPSLSAIP